MWSFVFLALYFSLASGAKGQFQGFVNHGLVAVGRLPASLFDKAGDGKQDTMGGFSAMAVDPESLSYADGMISGILYGLPDRGFGDGATDYRARLQVFRFNLRPYYGETLTGQNQIIVTNAATTLFTYDGGRFFTGFDANATNGAPFPQSAADSLGKGRRSLDAEGLVRLRDGSFWVSDEYGPDLLRFNAQGELQETLLPSDAFLPRVGNYPGKLIFSANAPPTSGRRNNRGFEGLTLTPDGKRLVAVLQSPTMQDAGGGNLGRNTRILEFDVEPNSRTSHRVVAEYIYPLALQSTTQTNQQTLVSEVLAVDQTTFLALERDANGRGSTNLVPFYKRVVLFSTIGASNIANSGYDLEKGAPGQVSLPASGLPPNLKAAARKDFIDLLDTTQLAKFGLNINADHDTNTLVEKWEALALIPLNENRKPDDYLLLIGSDNDFKAPVTFHNGQAVGTNAVSVDIMLLGYRVTLPGVSPR